MSVDELKKIVEELKNASKMHASQAERIQTHIDEMEESTNEQKLNLFLEKNVPTDASKWSYYKSLIDFLRGSKMVIQFIVYNIF